MAEIMFIRRNEQTGFRHQGDQQSFEEPFGVLCSNWKMECLQKEIIARGDNDR